MAGFFTARGHGTRGLYITNLPYGASEEEIRIHFETLGEVQSVVVCKDLLRIRLLMLLAFATHLGLGICFSEPVKVKAKVQ